MNFVNDVELDVGLARSKTNFLTQIADLINATIAGRINFDHIQQPALVHRLADGTGATRYAISFTHAVDGLGQQAGCGSFACATGAGKKVGVRHTIRCERVLQGVGHMTLPDDFVESARTPFAI